MDSNTAVRAFGDTRDATPRRDYSLRWTETGLAMPAPAGSRGDWPSDRWRRHLAQCGPTHECRHTVVEPRWWTKMIGRGVPLHPEARAARDAAHGVINRFKGQPTLPFDLLVFIQEAARDALCVAPQPLTKPWIRSTLAAVSMLVRWVASTGSPVTREHVFAERTVNRFLYQALSQHDPATVRVYRSRLELVRLGLQGVTVRDALAMPSLGSQAPETPLTPRQEADLYVWAAGLTPTTRRKRTLGLITITLGVGSRTPELLRVGKDDARVSADGVDVRLRNADGLVRTVTCRRAWEERLVEQIDITAPGHMLLTPWRVTPMNRTNFSTALVEAQRRFPPPTWINVTRLRNTWFTRMLEAGVPHQTLMMAADVRSETSWARLLPYCRSQDSRAAAASLRGGAP